jgi:hypothetical protein
MAGQGNCQQGKASDSANYPSSSRTISSILNTCLNQYLEDFCQLPDFLCLMLLIAYLQLNMLGSNEDCHAQLLLAQWEHLEFSEPETESEQPGVKIEHIRWEGCRAPQCGGSKPASVPRPRMSV